MNFTKVAEGIDVSALAQSIELQPELWNKNPCRLSENGPHRESQDILIRYKDETENIARNDWSNFTDPHLPEWYASTDLLPVKPLIFDLMSAVKGEMLGGVLIYRVQPGKKIHLHVDKGWHVNYFDKFNVCVSSNPKAAFVYGDERMVQKAGDIHWFRNDVPHEVVNEGDCDHIVMTVCIRVDKGYRVPWSPEGWSLGQEIKGGT